MPSYLKAAWAARLALKSAAWICGASTRQRLPISKPLGSSDQTLTPAEQIAFAKRFGAIHDHSFMQGLDDHPEILEKEEGDTKAFGETWHTDQMFSPKPAKATILYAKETPAVGGNTKMDQGARPGRV
jgi:hypothetical protein